MWYEIKVKANEEISDFVSSILVDMYASGIVEENPNDDMFQAGYDGDWDYFEVDMNNFEYSGVLIKAYVEFGETSEVKIDNKCMSSEITTLSGEKDFTAVVDEYVNIENWMHSFKSNIKELENYNLDVSTVEVEYKELEEVDYVKEWQSNYHAFEIAKSVVVCPSWESRQDFGDALVIYLDPGAAFGTGTHETTSMCTEAIIEYSNKIENKGLMYDVGCGSGILAIVAKKFGFDNVVGIDIDERSVEISIENARLNSVDYAIDFKVGNLLDVVDDKADMIVANIIADVIVSMSHDIKKRLKTQGIFICSGIIDDKLEMVIEKLQKDGFTIVEKKKKGEWNALVARV